MSVKGDYIADVPAVPGEAGSLWLATVDLPSFGELRGKTEADVAVVGGGMAGLLTAAYLVEAGRSVVVLEARNVLGDVTGHTTAKVTAQHGRVYSTLAPERARTYAEAQMWAVEEIFAIVERDHVSCDLAREPLYLYTADLGAVPTMRREAEAAAAAGLPAEFAESLPLPFPAEGGVIVRDQARFHPLRFGASILARLTSAGAEVHEHTRVVEVHDGDPCTLLTPSGVVHARDVVIASNFPMHDTAAFFSRLYPHRSYALAMRCAAGEGMAYTEDPPEFAVRYQPADRPGETLAIVSGVSHKAGQGGDERERYADLERLARERLGDGEILYHWSTQDNHTPDMVPYIGREPRDEHVWMATGFGGWGMTNSVVAGRLLADLIVDGTHEWAELFDPGRLHVSASAATFVAENADVAKGFAEGIFAEESRCESEEYAAGEGGVCVSDRRKVAMFRDLDGALHSLNPHCTHLRCIVGWNEAEKTWDCPCHGSRFEATGEVLHGPALKALRPSAREPQPAVGTGRDGGSR